MPVIYLDVLLVLNLWIDFLLLLATARVLRLPRRRGRLILGAAIGAASSCLLFLPPLSAWLTTLLKFAAAALILLAAFPWRGGWPYLKSVTVFFVISTVFAGLAAALWFFAAPQGFYVVNGVVYYDVDALMLVALTVVSYGIVCVFDRFTRKKAPIGSEYRLTVAGSGEPLEIRALYDSGNRLTEPFSGSPVAVVEYRALEPILPPEWREALRPGRDEDGERSPAGPAQSARPPQSADQALRARLRLIPFRSVGGNGLLPAFQPPQLWLTDAGGVRREITGTYIAVCDQLGRGDYQALIGADLAALAETGGPQRFARSDRKRREPDDDRTQAEDERRPEVYHAAHGVVRPLEDRAAALAGAAARPARGGDPLHQRGGYPAAPADGRGGGGGVPPHGDGGSRGPGPAHHP